MNKIRLNKIKYKCRGIMCKYMMLGVKDMNDNQLVIGDKIGILLNSKYDCDTCGKWYKAKIYFYYGDLLIEFEDKLSTVTFPKHLSDYLYPVNKVLKWDYKDVNKLIKEEKE